MNHPALAALRAVPTLAEVLVTDEQEDARLAAEHSDRTFGFLPWE